MFLVSSDVSLDNRHLCSILYSNCHSLLPKLDSLRVHATTSSPDIIALTETWLDHSISNSELLIPGYVIVRKDRNYHGGGVLAYIKDSIVIMNSAAHNILELLNIKLELHGLQISLSQPLLSSTSHHLSAL